MRSTSLTLLLGLSTQVTSQSTTFPPPAGCTGDCDVVFQGEASDWATFDINDDAFYNIPANASTAKPGDLLRWQDLSSEHLASNWTSVPAGMSVSRFIYMTEDIDRNPLPASAFVLLPFSSETVDEPAETKFPVIAWAHGTSGRVPQCAPTNNKMLYYGWEAPFFMASNGYAVIGVDYAGQGVNSTGGFNYEAGMLHAADVAYSVIAARSVIGNLLSEEWLVAGHSEGGMTAWRTNERLAMSDQDALLAAGKFVGAVAAAPALRPLDLIPEEVRRAGDGVFGDVVSIYLLQCLENLYPEIKVEDYLTDYMVSLLPIMDASCLLTGEVLMTNLTVAEVYKNTSWLESEQFKDWQDRYNGAGATPLAAPMLVVQGIADSLTYAENTEWDFNRTCKADPEASADLYLVPGLDHDPAFQASQPYYIEWIKQRFSGVGAKQGCRIHTATPVNDRYKKDMESV